MPGEMQGQVQPQAPQDGEQAVKQLMAGINNGFDVMKEQLGANLPPEAMQELNGIQQAYQGFVSKLLGDGAPQAPQGSALPQPGGNVPVGVQAGASGVPVGP